MEEVIVYEKRTPEMSTWKGRQPKGFRCTHSFRDFVDKAKRFKEGKDHLVRHHNGYGL